MCACHHAESETSSSSGCGLCVLVQCIDQQSVVALLRQHNDWLRNNWPDLTADALCNLHAWLLGGLWKRLPHQEYFVLLRNPSPRDRVNFGCHGPVFYRKKSEINE
jgi:hypothetical protein